MTDPRVMAAHRAIVRFNFGNYGMDDVENLARREPEMDVFLDLAYVIVAAIEEEERNG